MHINLYDEIGAYDLSAIFDKAVDDEPWLMQVGTDSDSTAAYVIGRYFAGNLREQLMIALAMGARVVDMSIHPLIATPLAHYLHHRQAVEADRRPVPMHEQPIDETIIECDLHSDPEVDPLCLVREVVTSERRPDDVPRALARLTLERIWERLEAILTTGGNRIHMLVPANAADLSGSFRKA